MTVPGFKCSCPSRKLPCKHTLGLLYLFASHPESFEANTPPEWVSLWLAKRAEQSERQAAKEEAPNDPPDTNEKERRAAQRMAQREKKMLAGIEELDTWLHDLLRQGLANAQNQPYSFWETSAARLIDAQAPGLGRMVRDMGGICASGEGWQSRMMEQIGRVYLLMEGYRHLETLPETTQSDLLSLIGITQKQEEVLEGQGVQDTWLVIGREVEEEGNLKAQRVWLWGRTSGQMALVLNFAAPGGSLDTSLMPGTALTAELVFYPGAVPMRAVMRSRGPLVTMGSSWPGQACLVDAVASCASSLAANPWLERFPVALSQVIPVLDENKWRLVDAEGHWAPLSKNFLDGWKLLAISGGMPVSVFGEWNGASLLPLSTWHGEGKPFYAFPARIE